MRGVPRRLSRCEPGEAQRLGSPAQNLCQARCWNRRERLFMFPRPEVALQNHVMFCRGDPLRDGEQNRKACGAEQPRMRRAVRCADDIEQRFFDEVLAQEHDRVALSQALRKRGFTAARQTGNEE